MKILHTADWHIGKVLHKHSLEDEMKLFLDWLIETIKQKEIDVLLISGDVFDIANPAIQDRATYYRFLSQLIGLPIQVVITGGNHDSIGMLDAPGEILRNLNISVVGGAKGSLKDELIEIKNKDGEVEMVVAAVPFLRDRDLRTVQTDKNFEHREDALKAGIAGHYTALADLCTKEYPGVPALAMGHLYARGVSTSESERDIHIGNAAAVDSSIFPNLFGYVALGHIHRPQIIGGNEYIRYSGSPIALSFSEKEDQKCVLLIELQNKKFSKPVVLEVPKSRALKKIKGSLKEVTQQLSEYHPTYPLPSFVELEIMEEEFSAEVLVRVEELLSLYEQNESFSILKSKTHFNHGAKDTADLFKGGERIEDLKPLEVFRKLLEFQSLSKEKEQMVTDAFMVLLENVYQSEEP